MEAEKRKKDNAEMKRKQDQNLPEAFKQLTKQSDGPAIKRSKLNLPKPQVSDTDIEEIVKVGTSNRSMPPPNMSSTGITEDLVQEYEMTPGPLTGQGSFRTPRTPAGEDIVLREAQNAIALTQQQSALHGGENTPLHESDFSSVTPATGPAATPNLVLGTPAYSKEVNEKSATPFRTPMLVPPVGATPGRTPVRDKLLINREEESEATVDEIRRRTKNALLSGLASLPKAKNDFEIVVPELPEEPSVSSKPVDFEVDAADVNAEYEKLLHEEKERKVRLQSKAIQRNLPRPSVVNENMVKFSNTRGLNETQMADMLIQKEIVAVLEYDRDAFPVDGGEPSGNPYLEQFDEKELSAADALLQEESRKVENEMKGSISVHEYADLWLDADREVMFNTSQKRYGRTSMIDSKEKCLTAISRFDNLNSYLKATQKRSGKLKKKVNILLGGYLAKKKTLVKDIEMIFENLEKKEIELKSYEKLSSSEELAARTRMESWEMDVDNEKKREKGLQARYQELIQRKRQLSL